MDPALRWRRPCRLLTALLSYLDFVSQRHSTRWIEESYLASPVQKEHLLAIIEFLDQILRDGHRSLWGMRIRSGYALPVAANIDRVGYRTVDYTGASAMEVMVRYCQENP